MNEQKVRDMLIDHKIVSVKDDMITLDNNTELIVVKNECGDWLKELNSCDNIITSVEFKDIMDKRNDASFRIFGFVEDKRTEDELPSVYSLRDRTKVCRKAWYRISLQVKLFKY